MDFWFLILLPYSFKDFIVHVDFFCASVHSYLLTKESSTTMALILLWSTTDCSTALWRWRLRKVAQLAGATDRRPPTAFTATNCPAPFRSSQQLSSPQLRNSAVVAEPARELIVCAASALRAPVRRERSRVPCCASVSDGQIIVSDRITVALAPTNGK